MLRLQTRDRPDETTDWQSSHARDESLTRFLCAVSGQLQKGKRIVNKQTEINLTLLVMLAAFVLVVAIWVTK